MEFIIYADFRSTLFSIYHVSAIKRLLYAYLLEITSSFFFFVFFVLILCKYFIP